MDNFIGGLQLISSTNLLPLQYELAHPMRQTRIKNCPSAQAHHQNGTPPLIGLPSVGSREAARNRRPATHHHGSLATGHTGPQGTCKPEKKKGQAKTRPESGKPASKHAARQVASSDESGLNYFQAVVNSSLFRRLNQQYMEMRVQQERSARLLKKDIDTLQFKIARGKEKMRELHGKRYSLMEQGEELSEELNEIQLANYEMRCQLNMVRGGTLEYSVYESEPDLELDDMDYEEMLALEEEMGAVEVGYSEDQLKALPKKAYKSSSLSQQENCCICCCQLQQGDPTFTGECGHTHHFDCIRRWLALKRHCPLCRAQIMI